MPDLLRRTPTPAEVFGWVNSSLDLRTIEPDVPGSSEYEARV
jgi:hypothetical protein